MANLALIAQAAPWVFQIFFFCTGACLGSFFNVCIYRIPEGKSVVTPGSTCSCGQPVRWLDNIPVLSWFLLRGKARCCGAKFSIRYAVVELLTGLLFLASWQLYGLHNPPLAIGTMLLCCCLVPSVFIDLDHMLIPDIFSVGGAVMGVLFSCLYPQLHGIEGNGPGANVFSGMESLLGLFIGSAAIYWIGVLGEAALRKEAMGEGDVKLLGCIGAFTGWQGAVFSLFGGAFCGLLFLLPFIVIQKLRPPKSSGGETQSADTPTVGLGIHIPFGPMLAFGAILYLFLFKDLTDGYFQSVTENLRLLLRI